MRSGNDADLDGVAGDADHPFDNASIIIRNIGFFRQIRNLVDKRKRIEKLRNGDGIRGVFGGDVLAVGTVKYNHAIPFDLKKLFLNEDLVALRIDGGHHRNAGNGNGSEKELLHDADQYDGDH